MNAGILISETRSQRKDRALHCPFASIENCKPALHSHSLELNLCIPEQPMKKHCYAMQLRAPERASTNGLLWPRWCQLGCHSFPSLILGMSKYLEKSRSSNEYRNLNLPKSRSQRKERRALHCPFALIVDCISARDGGYGPHLPNAEELGRLAVLSQPAPQQPGCTEGSGVSQTSTPARQSDLHC